MKSRAVLRYVQPSNESVPADCPACGGPLKYSARTRPQVVLCNVYRAGTWVRTEHWHPSCYDENGKPHGEVDTNIPAMKPGFGRKAG